MPPKRPIRNVFGNDDDDPSAPDVPNGTPPKKHRPDPKSSIHRAGVAPLTMQHAATSVAPQNGSGVRSGAGDNSIQAQVAAAKARVQAFTSAFRNKGAVPAPAATPAASRLSAVGSSASNGRSTGTITSAPVAAPTSTGAASTSSAARPPAAAAGSTSIQAQLEAARAKFQAQMAALNSKNKPPSTSVASQSTSGFKPVAAPTPSPSSASASSSKAPTGIHPLLLSSELPYRSTSSIDPKIASSSSYVKGRNAVPPESNPYLQASRELAASDASEGPKQRSMHKGFQFHKPGRHVREAEELRREQQMEELKKRIEASARKAGLQDELNGDEKWLVRAAPPAVEWWDVNLLPSEGGSYDDVPDSVTVEQMLETARSGKILLYGPSSPIDRYIQHPIPIPAPSDSIAVPPRGLMLTKHEQRKLRRQRRAAEQQDKRDRIKMGLLPPEPPKVKLSNLMRVLTSEAVSDPTKIEARVRREIAARKEAHERTNAEKTLTPEQRREKLQRQQDKEEHKGVYCQVYRIKHLVSPRHKFKVQRNALDHALTGVCIFHPSMALVVVEGSGQALKKYKRLMMVRVDWTDPGEAKEADDSDEDVNANNTPLTGFRNLTTATDDVDWSTNSCELIFEGPLRQRNWQGRGFRAKAAPTDQAAREALGEHMQGYWDVAKRALQSQEDGF